jgi:putative glutamine amidotransferase
MSGVVEAVVVVVVVVVVSVVSVAPVVVEPSPPQPARPSVTAISENPTAMRPVIGITAYAEDASWGVWKVPAALTPLAYVTKVEAAGGRPLLVPPSDDAVQETLDVLDGLVFTGGPDLDPELYDAAPHPETTSVRPERDRAEIALLNAALERDMPVLAICRGSQVLNVALGGDLEQHVPDLVGHEGHKETPGVFSKHPVSVDQGSRLHAVVGDTLEVSSHHHQGYGRLGDGLEVVARADDGTIEALEAGGHAFALGVLWHPEDGDDLRLFEELVAEAHSYRKRR